MHVPHSSITSYQLFAARFGGWWQPDGAAMSASGKQKHPNNALVSLCVACCGVAY